MFERGGDLGRAIGVNFIAVERRAVRYNPPLDYSSSISVSGSFSGAEF